MYSGHSGQNRKRKPIENRKKNAIIYSDAIW